MKAIYKREVISMTRYREIRKAIACIKESDPETDICYSTVRYWVVNGYVRNIRVGKTEKGSRILIDLDDLIDYLANPGRRKPIDKSNASEPEISYPGYIRPIPE